MTANNIASRNTAQPLYSLEAEVYGFHIVVQDHDLRRAQKELQREKDRVVNLVLEKFAA